MRLQLSRASGVRVRRDCICRGDAAQRQQALGEATELLLDCAELKPGDRVLDLAAGTGDTSILAARRVGPAGAVLAVDISAPMLEEASAVAAREGLNNLETLVSDIVYLDLAPQRFGAAICRFGLMFLADPVEGLQRVRTTLKPGARLAALVWSTAERNPFISIPILLSQQWSGPAARASITAVSLSGPGVFGTALEKAGFVGVGVRTVPVQRDFGSVDAALESIQQSSATLRELMRTLDAHGQERALAEVQRRLSEFVGTDGRCIVPGEALLGVATAP